MVIASKLIELLQKQISVILYDPPVMWMKTLEQYDVLRYYSMESYGYQETNNDGLLIRWMTISSMPDNISLGQYGNCTNGSRRCKCSKNNLTVTSFCGCAINECTNRMISHV